MTLPNFSYEQRLWDNGLNVVAGADEVGKGCFAGPVVAAVVAFAPISNSGLLITNKNNQNILINDSKKLSPLQRERTSEWIRKNAFTYGIGVGSVAKINRFGINSATNFAFRSAFRNAQDNINTRIQYLLIDAFYIPYIRNLRMPLKAQKVKSFKIQNVKSIYFYANQMAIVKGDAKSISIAGASVVAKVYRDKLMQDLGKKTKYKKYGWGKNKGYGTREHCDAILRYGISCYHRKQFVGTFIKNLKNTIISKEE